MAKTNLTIALATVVSCLAMPAWAQPSSSGVAPANTGSPSVSGPPSAGQAQYPAPASSSSGAEIGPSPSPLVPQAPAAAVPAADATPLAPDARTAPGWNAGTRRALLAPPEATAEPEVGATTSGREAAQTFEYRFTATLDLANVLWRSGHGYQLFADDGSALRLGIGAGYDLFRLPNNWVVATEAGYLIEAGKERNQGLLGGDLAGSLSASTLLAGGSLRWILAPWLAPFGRLAVLASRIDMDVTAVQSLGQASPSSAANWSYGKWVPGALLGAGVLLSLPPRNRVNVGLIVEGGLWLQRSVDIQLNRELSEGAIPTAGARLGSLQNTGPYLRIAGVLRF